MKKELEVIHLIAKGDLDEAIIKNLTVFEESIYLEDFKLEPRLIKIVTVSYRNKKNIREYHSGTITFEEHLKISGGLARELLQQLQLKADLSFLQDIIKALS